MEMAEFGIECSYNRRIKNEVDTAYSYTVFAERTNWSHTEAYIIPLVDWNQTHWSKIWGLHIGEDSSQGILGCDTM
jgi:hypothetical protein